MRLYDGGIDEALEQQVVRMSNNLYTFYIEDLMAHRRALDDTPCGGRHSKYA